MALDNAKNFAKTTVSIGYNAAAVSIVLQTGDGAKLPTAPFNATWYNSTDYADPSDDPNVEIVRVTNIATDTLTITRAQESTSATIKNTAGKVYKLFAGLTAKVINTDIPGLAGGTQVYSEVPTGSATSFTIAHTPIAGSLRLFRNGVRLQAGASNDYTLSGTTITMNQTVAGGEVILADYNY